MDDKTLPLGFMTTKNCNNRWPIAVQGRSAVILTQALAACSTARDFTSNSLGCRHRRLDIFALADRTDVDVWNQMNVSDAVESLEDWSLSATCPRIRFQPTDYMLTSGMGLNMHQAQALSLLSPRHHVLPVRHIFLVIQHSANAARGANDRARLHEHYLNVSLLWTNYYFADVV
jgi:hypothetical protein